MKKRKILREYWIGNDGFDEGMLFYSLRDLKKSEKSLGKFDEVIHVKEVRKKCSK